MKTFSQAFAALLLLICATARADDAACQKSEAEGLADGLKASEVILQLPLCYGAQDENHSLTKEIRALVDKTPTPENLSLALKKLASRVQDDALYGDQSARDHYAQKARAAASDVEKAVGPGNGATVVPVWQMHDNKTLALPEVDVEKTLDASCPDGANVKADPCLGAINSAKAWLRVFQLTERTLTQYAAPALDALLQRSTTRLAMWHSYRDDALPQFQWEWLLNSWRLNKEDKGPHGRARDKDGQPIGPMNVPTDQWIFLHPGVGLEYRDRPDESSASGESKTAPIVYLEIFGRNRWSWNEKTGEMIGGSGVSLVATYAARDDDTEVGYGLLFHSRRSKAYTLGITRSGDATNIIFNADLAEFFKEKMAYWSSVGEMATK